VKIKSGKKMFQAVDLLVKLDILEVLVMKEKYTEMKIQKQKMLVING
jgi:hypothetical protein